jgi:L-threonylcarbamoyladenylate synthase
MSGARVIPEGDEALELAAEALRAGEVVVVPTDTVYGLVARPDDPNAVAKVFALKRRPERVPLQVLVADRAQADELAASGLGPVAAQLAERFWPGGLTIVVARRPGIELHLGEAGHTVGLRCPDHGFVRALCRRVGPLAATSANVHGDATPNDAAEIARLLGPGVALVVDGGPCSGVASTVVAVEADDAVPRLIRHGALRFEELLRQLGEPGR